MNNLKTTQPTKSSLKLVSTTRRQAHRTRDFGVGYGNSSGYASERRYTSDWSQIRFRMG
ncbi:MAG: hypothetical protein M3Q96_01935 [Pseudomonadota bacterium]|nr:hypothetical protein [Pseudomonadota bacterium]MDQ3228245.1 hypothetical protein [Pseudomonadota bacterium]